MELLTALLDKYRTFMGGTGAINATIHFLHVPLMLLAGMVAAVWIAHMVFSLTPIGLAFNAEAIWTTLMSPLLVVGYPLAAVHIAKGGNTECMKVSKMLENRKDYTTMDFVTQIVMKENRTTAPMLVGLSVFLKSLSTAAGFSWD